MEFAIHKGVVLFYLKSRLIWARGGNDNLAEFDAQRYGFDSRRVHQSEKRFSRDHLTPSIFYRRGFGK